MYGLNLVALGLVRDLVLLGIGFILDGLSFDDVI